MHLENIDKAQFWDKKIVDWENKNYNGRFWGSAIRNRRKLFLQVVGQSLKGKVVLDAGCGSAGLVEDLFAVGIERYIGCDISHVAIAEAKVRAARAGLTLKTELLTGNILNIEKIECDFIFSLGLWDWLSDAEIIAMIKKSNASEYLHSFSEFRISPSQLFHRMYVFSAYGRKNLTYTPRYRPSRQIEDIFKSTSASAPKFFRNSAMSFSTFAMGKAIAPSFV